MGEPNNDAYQEIDAKMTDEECGLCLGRGDCNGYIDLFQCTRPEGHPGPHVACGSTHHRKAVWAQ